MGTVRVLSEARMLEIEANSIVDAALDGDDLVLTTHGGTDINVGSVRGPQGNIGPAGPNIPIGAGVEWYSDTLPAEGGFLFQDGSAVSRTTYAALFGVIGTTFGDGDGSTTFNLPDRTDRVGVGKSAEDGRNAIGLAGGSDIAVLPDHVHDILAHDHSTPNHTHTADHNHTASSANDSHTHDTNSRGGHDHGDPSVASWDAGGQTLSWSGTWQGSATMALESWTSDGSHTHTALSDTHKHTITVNSKNVTTSSDNGGNTGQGGGGTTATAGVVGATNYPPFLIVRYIIRFG